MLGFNVLDHYYEQLTDEEYDTSVLNERKRKVSQGFYPRFNAERHTYVATDDDYIENLDFGGEEDPEENSRWNKDCLPNLPLYVALDWQLSILPIVIGQQHRDAFRIIHATDVLHPGLIRDLCKKICRYYQDHQRKEMHFYYDSTAVSDNPRDTNTNANEFIAIMRESGWNVKPHYMGQLPSQTYRYRFINAIFTEPAKHDIPPVLLNRYRCPHLIKSIELCGSKQKKEGFEKDKLPERNPSANQRHTPHYSDAFDQLLCGLFRKRYKEKRTAIGRFFSK